ncbi:hypothetical protein [Porphyrobacter sp. TH134]|uniref:hypothetical protein n=1 Tax=Porphyrobacter sp. TH134 TaxID=2067450 RepID=UPI001181140E|nr:hypothetical protein [Porphyrobacter sp. TH134]
MSFEFGIGAGTLFKSSGVGSGQPLQLRLIRKYPSLSRDLATLWADRGDRGFMPHGFRMLAQDRGAHDAMPDLHGGHVRACQTLFRKNRGLNSNGVTLWPSMN